MLSFHKSDSNNRICLLHHYDINGSQTTFKSLKALMPLVARWRCYGVPEDRQQSVSEFFQGIEGDCQEWIPTGETPLSGNVIPREWLLWLPAGCALEMDPGFDITTLDDAVGIYRLKARDALGMTRWLSLMTPADIERTLESDRQGWKTDSVKESNLAPLAVNLAADREVVLRAAAQTIVSLSGGDSPGSPLEGARAYEMSGDDDSAWSWYRHIAFDDSQPAQDRWYARYRMACTGGAMGYSDDEIEGLCHYALKLLPNRAEPMVLLARIYRNSGRADKAMEMIEQAMCLPVPDDDGYFDYAVYDRTIHLEGTDCAAESGDDIKLVRFANQFLRKCQVGDDAKRVDEMRTEAYLRLNPVLPVNPNRNNFFVIVVAFRNAVSYLQDCIDSIRAQTYRNYRVILIDDASNDGGLQEIDLDGVADHRIIINPDRRCALENQHHALMRYAGPDDIAVFLDGDDRFSDGSVLTRLNDIYNQTSCWVTYGQSRRIGDGGIGYACPFLPGDTLEDIFGKFQMLFPIHLRSHRAGLFHRIADQDPDFGCLKDESGAFYAYASDVAHMRAIMFLAGMDRIRYMPEVLYEYNEGNPDSHHRLHRQELAEDVSDLSLGKPLETVSTYLPDNFPFCIHANRRRCGLLVFALEGADSTIIDSMRAAGEMPNLDSLIDQQRQLGVPEGFGNDVFWRAIYGGKVPGEHSDYFRVKIQQGGYHSQNIHELEGFGETDGFWLELAALGHQVAVLNAPETKMQTVRNLTWMSQWLVHAPISQPLSSPPTMMENLNQAPGVDKLHYVIDNGRIAGLDDLDVFYKLIVDKQARKLEAYRQLLGQGGWDLFFCCFDGIHDVAHKLWHFHDPRSRHYEESSFDPVLEMYRETDHALGQLVEMAGDVPVGIVTGLGLHRMCSLNSMLGEILRRLEAHYTGSNSSSERQDCLFMEVANNPVTGAVRFNLAGRDPLGKISTTAYPDLRERLITDLLDIRSVNSDSPVIDRIIDVDENFPGPYRSGLPDLMLYWKQGASDGSFCSDIIGEMDFTPNPNMVLDYRTGDHNFNGAILGNHSFFHNVSIDDGLPCQQVAEILKSRVKGEKFIMDN